MYFLFDSRRKKVDFDTVVAPYITTIKSHLNGWIG